MNNTKNDFINCSKRNFTVITNFATKDMGLKANERAILWTMLAMPNDWDFSIENIMREIDMSRDTIRKSLNTLREKNYIVRTQTKEGRLLVYRYFVNDTPFGLNTDECNAFLKRNKFKFNSNEPNEEYQALMEKSNQFIMNEFKISKPKKEVIDEILLEVNKDVVTLVNTDEGVEMTEPVTVTVKAPKQRKRAYTDKVESKPKKTVEKEPNLMELVTKYTDDIELRETFEAYLEMREQKKKRPTGRALVMIFNKLDKIAYSVDDKIEIVRQSTINAWTDVYELKTNQTPKKGNSISFMDL